MMDLHCKRYRLDLHHQIILLLLIIITDEDKLLVALDIFDQIDEVNRETIITIIIIEAV